MNKILFSLAACASLVAAPQAVVFDWGDVLAKNDRSLVINFICETLQCSEAEAETANLEKRNAMKAGKSEIDFWLDLAKQKGVQLQNNWPEAYTAAIKASVGADPEMFAIIDELKDQKIQIGLLSNINDRYTALIRGFGFYQPFDPCLLSCEIGLEKPNKEAYEALLKALNIPAEEIVFIDDKPENIEAAKQLGIDAILFESPKQVRADLSKRELLTNQRN